MEFLRPLRKNGKKLYITIPLEIIRFHNLNKGDIVKVTLTKTELKVE